MQPEEAPLTVDDVHCLRQAGEGAEEASYPAPDEHWPRQCVEV